MKTKKGNVKSKVKKGNKSVEKDSFGFQKGSKSSQAVLQLAEKALLKDTRKKFKTLSFSKLFVDLQKRGFKVEQNDQGLCSITAQSAKG